MKTNNFEKVLKVAYNELKRLSPVDHYCEIELYSNGAVKYFLKKGYIPEDYDYETSATASERIEIFGSYEKGELVQTHTFTNYGQGLVLSDKAAIEKQFKMLIREAVVTLRAYHKIIDYKTQESYNNCILTQQ